MHVCFSLIGACRVAWRHCIGQPVKAMHWLRKLSCRTALMSMLETATWVSWETSCVGGGRWRHTHPCLFSPPFPSSSPIFLSLFVPLSLTFSLSLDLSPSLTLSEESLDWVLAASYNPSSSFSQQLTRTRSHTRANQLVRHILLATLSFVCFEVNHIAAFNWARSVCGLYVCWLTVRLVLTWAALGIGLWVRLYSNFFMF